MQRTALLFALLLLVCPTDAESQANAPGKPVVLFARYEVHSYKFKPGMADEARKIIYEHFWPVNKEIGREVMLFEGVNGDWDIMLFFLMPDEPSELTVKDSRLEKKWEEAFIRREGGRDKLDAMVKKFSAMVQDKKKSENVRRRIH